MAIGSHTIPRFYLEQFANPSTRSGKPGNVWVYEKNKPSRPSSTKAQGYENAYFAFVRPDGTTDESFESYVAKLEDRCNDALVCAKSELYDLTSLAHRNELASYVGLLFARSTSRRKFSAENWAKLQQPYGQLEFNEEYVQDAAAHYSETTGVTIGPEKIRELIRNQAASFATKKLTGNTFVENLLFHAETLKAELLQRPWQVLKPADDAEFVTSDNPVITFIKLREDLWHPGHGFRKPGVIVAFPLASTACLTVGVAGRDCQTVDAATVKRMNELIVSCCDRFVYSKTKSQEITDMVNNFGGWSVPGKTAFVGEMPGTEKIEEFLRQKMGIKKRAASGSK
jgi:Protein of unknown function (DUF4238)